MCRRAQQSITHHSPEAELRSLRQGCWVRGSVEVCAGKVSMLFRTKAVRSHPVTQAHTVSKPLASAFDLGFICGCCVLRNLSVCQIRHGSHIQSRHHLWGQEAVWGEPRLSHGAKLLIGTSTWNTAASGTTSSFGGNEFCHCWPSVLKWSCYVT